MLDLLNRLGNQAHPDEEPESPPSELAPLRLLAAPMLLLTGIEATLEARRRARVSGGQTEDRGQRRENPAGYAAQWAPSLLTPLAAAAQVAHLSRPSEAVTMASRVLNTAVVGAGIGAMAEMLVAYQRRGQAPSLAPLALTAAGLLALLLDRQEQRVQVERSRLEHRANVVERLVPRRRARLDRIVVHV